MINEKQPNTTELIMIKQDIHNTIEFLSSMAANATLKEPVNLSIAMNNSKLSEELKALLLEKNTITLAKELKVDQLIVSNIVRSPFEEESEEELQIPRAVNQ